MQSNYIPEKKAEDRFGSLLLLENIKASSRILRNNAMPISMVGKEKQETNSRSASVLRSPDRKGWQQETDR